MIDCHMIQGNQNPVRNICFVNNYVKGPTQVLKKLVWSCLYIVWEFLTFWRISADKRCLKGKIAPFSFIRRVLWEYFLDFDHQSPHTSRTLVKAQEM